MCLPMKWIPNLGSVNELSLECAIMVAKKNTVSRNRRIRHFIRTWDLCFSSISFFVYSLLSKWGESS